MPKPTFMQSVLRKPTRSYANPHGHSPWADDDAYSESSYYRPASRYSSRTDHGVHLGFREEPEEYYEPPRSQRYQPRQLHDPDLEPPAPRRRARSVVSAAPSERYETMSEVPDVSSKTRFPKAVKRTQTVVAIRNGRIVYEQVERPEAGPSRSPTVKKSSKASRSRRGSSGEESVLSARTDAKSIVSSGTVRRKKRDEARRVEEPLIRQIPSRMSSYSTDKTPSLAHSNHNRQSDVSSAGPSSPVGSDVHGKASYPSITTIQQSRPRASVVQKKVPLGEGPLTPPSSQPSSDSSLRLSYVRQAPDAEQPRRRSPIASEVVFTPEERQELSAERDQARSVPVVIASHEITGTEGDREAVESTPSPPSGLAPPSFSLQPPTPAAVEEVASSPFGAQTASPSDATHPGAGAETHSLAGEAGSDHEDSPAQSLSPPSHSRTPSFSAQAPLAVPLPASVIASSRPPSVRRSPAASVDGRLSRSSTMRHTARRSFDEFAAQRRGSYAVSEVSAGGSLITSNSGYGKGGWAAAHAASSTLSRPTSPILMQMPPSGSTGFEDFQPPKPASKFTPLPVSAQPKSFVQLAPERAQDLMSDTRSVGRSEGSRRVPAPRYIEERDSMPSTYSRSSSFDEEEERDLPQASRSYVQTGVPLDQQPGGIQMQNERRDSLAPVPPPRNPARRFSAVSGSRSATGPTGGNDRQYFPSSASSYSQATSAYPSRIYAQSHAPYPYDESPFHNSPSPDDGSPFPSRPPTPPAVVSTRTGFEPPSFLNPDLLTILPTVSAADSAKLLEPTPTESGRSKRYSTNSYAASIRRAGSVLGGAGGSRYALSEAGGDARPEDDARSRRAKSVIGHRGLDNGSRWEGSSYGEGVLLESNGLGETVKGYTSLVLPTGAYVPSDPTKTSSKLDRKILGMPHAAMASITLSSSAHRLAMTPVHLRGGLPLPVDFSHHLKPPSKVGKHQVLLEVYAVAVDRLDVDTVEEKGKSDVGKWVPGRSFVGRALQVGAEEKDIVRGDIVVGLTDVKKSGALSEYIVVDRRRLAKAPYPTALTLEQLAMLPLHGIPAARALKVPLARHSRAIVMDAHSGVSALVCQELSRNGVSVTAIIGGGDRHLDAQRLCMENGARGVMTGPPAAVINNLDEGWDYILDTAGGSQTYLNARRILKEGARFVSLHEAEADMPLRVRAASKPSGLKTLRAAFQSKRKDSKYIAFQYLPPAGSGEPELDASGLDLRDLLEEPCMSTFRPVVGEVWNFERGMEAFRRETNQTRAGILDAQVVRIMG